MFNRRMFVALAACLAISASTAFAGGNGGTKKDAHIKCINESGFPVYVFVDVDASKIESAAVSSDPERAFKRLGGRLLQASGSHSFPVKAGQHHVTAIDVENEVVLLLDEPVWVDKGQTAKVFIPEFDDDNGTGAQ